MPAQTLFASSAASATSAPIDRGWYAYRWWIAGILLIVGLTAFAYWPAMNGQFILDDEVLITDNDIIQSPSGLYWFWFTTQPTDYWPLTNTSFWIEWRLWGMNSTGYHLTNLVLHIAAAILIWIILRKLSVPGAFLAAILFAVHPVNVESVAWISQRKNTLAMVFCLLSILAYLRHAERNSARWYWLSLLAFLLSMLSKGSVAVLPVVLLLMVWWQRGRINKYDIGRTIPFFIVAIILTGVNIWFQKHGLDLVVRDVTFWQRLAGAGGAVWFYLSKAFAPFHLVFVYPQWQIDPRQLLWWLPVLAAAIVTKILWWRQRSSPGSGASRAVFFAWLLFCVALIPVLGFTDVGFMQYSLVADHYEHLALIAVVALAGAAWAWWFRRSLGAVRFAAIAVAAGLVGMLTYLTCQQTPLYSSPLALYRATLRQNPNSWLLHNNVGVSLHKVGQLIPSIAHLQVALTLNPNFADAHYNYANVLLHLGQISNAIEEYEKALRLKANYASAHDNLGSALAQSGRGQEAVEQFQESLRIKPQSAITHNNLGNALNDLGQTKEAIEQYKMALRLKPDYAEAHNNLGVALFDSDLPVAILEFQLALQKKPNYADAENNLGNALLSNEQPQLAIEHYQQALRLKPAYVEAYANLAKALAQTNQRAEAISAAEKAVEYARAKNRQSLSDQIEAWLTEYRSNANPAGKPGSDSGATHPSP